MKTHRFSRRCFLRGIGVTMAVSCREVASENSREPSASLPPDSWTFSHFAMSSGDE